MENQPCPDCGTLMEASHFLYNEGTVMQAWHCGSCGQYWTDEQIELVYKLMGISADEKENTDGPQD